MESNRDPLIWDLLKDPRFRITAIGTIERRVFANRKDLIGREIWKRAGFFDDKGNNLISYKGKKLRVNRVVFAHFTGYLRKNIKIRNKDGNRGNNHPDNLEAINQGALVYNVYVSGRRKATAKLSWNQAQEIKELYRSNKWTQKKLAEKYGVAPSTIAGITRGETYKKQYVHRIEESSEV